MTAFGRLQPFLKVSIKVWLRPNNGFQDDAPRAARA
jgi:hypothetical protein